MENCGQKNQQEFLSLYMFENGSSCDPQKLRVRRSTMENFLKKIGKNYFYTSKAVYNLSGEAVTSLAKVKDNSSFVVVRPHETFIALNYEDVFQKLMKKKYEKNNVDDSEKRSKSAPAVPSIDFISKCRETCKDDERKDKYEVEVAPKTRKYCISRGNYPCSFGDSDEEDDEPKRIPKASKCSSKLSRKSIVQAACQECEEETDERIPKADVKAKSKVSINLEQCGDGHKSLENRIKKSCISRSKYPCSFEESDEEDDCKSKSRAKQDSNCSLSSHQSKEKDCDKPRKSSMKKGCKLADENLSDSEVSDKEENCNTKVKKSKSKRSGRDGRRSAAAAYKEKKGFWETLCCKTPKAKPLCSDGSRPGSGACNVKQTQTTSQDLIVSQKIFKLALKEEKKLDKIYGKDKKTLKNLRSCAEQKAKAERGEIDCGKPVSEHDFQKALDKYRQKRKKMEKETTKGLEKELRKAEVSRKKTEDLKKNLEKTF